MKKYEFTGKTQEVDEKTLHQIKRISDGLIGGWIQDEANLSHEGDCFIYGDAQVFGDARVCGDALVCGNARVFGKAQVFGDAEVCGDCFICGNARVFGKAQVFGDAEVCGDCFICGNARVFGDALVRKDSIVKTKVINVETIKHSLTVADNNITIGCETHSHDFWLDNFRSIGEKYDYSDFEIETYGKLIEILIEQKKYQLKKLEDKNE